MLKIHLRTALKAFTHNKVYSFVNVFGLTLGLSACMIVATVVIDDLSYDRQWSKSKDLYRIISEYKLGAGLYDRHSSSFVGLGPELRKDFPQVEATTAMTTGSLLLRFNESTPDGVSVTSLETDTSVWRMLDIRVISGNPRAYVEGQNNLLISESIRDKFFPGSNPVGKTIYQPPTYGEKPKPYLITGVIRDLPANTHLRAAVIHIHKWSVVPLSHQNEGYFRTQYLLIRPGTDMQQFTQQVNSWYDHYISKDNKYRFSFQPIRDVYLHSEFNQSQEVKGNIRNIYIFSAVAFLLLLIACLNFINLSVARAVTRMQETGVRKVLGAGRGQIVLQFLTESLVYFAMSAVLAFIVYQAFLPAVAQYLGHTLVRTLMSGLSLFGTAAGVILVVSVFTGIYPAWLLSGFKPANALRGKGVTGGSGAGLRRVLVVAQFSISIAVLIAMIVVRGQVRFMENADVGFNKKDLLRISGVSWDGKGDVIKNEIRRIPGVEDCSITSFSPSEGGGYMWRDAEDPSHPGQKIKIWYILGDVDFPQTIGLHLQSGRLFNKDLRTDAANEDSLEQNILTQPSLITASTAKLLRIRKINEAQKDGWTTPIGIVADFHNESFREELGPTFILADRSPTYGVMLVRVKAGAQVTAALQKTWKQVYPDKPLDISWVEDLLNSQYAAETRLQQLFSFFSLLTMILAALGIFGLVVHAAGQRVKEIGVRKVLGASVASIVGLLSADFVKLVALAALIASPVSWWVMNKWLQDYAYRIHISWWMFALAGGTTLLIALITVSFQAVKSARVNPVDCLRVE